jgi:hypothetical protein
LTVAVLYIDPRGPYPSMPNVDCWDEARDAKQYAGPHPVVAHPPCGPWGVHRSRCRKQDPSCGPAAVAAVRRFGGVLEHPAGSLLFREMNMPKPGEAPDAHGGVTFALEQVSWGHVARKKTWIYTVGVPLERVTQTLRTGGTPTHWISGGLWQTPPGIKCASSQQARRTPPAFAEWLVSLARSVQP